MKNLILFVLFILSSSFTLLAQAPQSFKYQGVARDNGTIITGNIGLQLSIRATSPTGTIVYQENQSPITNDYGVFSVDVGGNSATVTQGIFTDIDWSLGDYFLQVEIDPAGGTSFVDMGTTSLASVPYALYAATAQTALDDFDTDPNNENQNLQLNGAVLSITNGNSVTLPIRSSIADADGDTKIQVEETSNDDIIRFDIAGSEKFIIKNNATGSRTRIETSSNGNNILIGRNTGNNMTTSSIENIMIGSDAGRLNETGNGNVIIGTGAGQMGTSPFSNTFIGYRTGQLNTTGDNTFVGAFAGSATTTGGENTFLGSFTGPNNTVGSFNTFLGRYAGQLSESGNNNTYVGWGAGGQNVAGNSNVFLGSNAGNVEMGSNKLYIENSNSSNPLIYGEFDNNFVKINGKLAIGTNSPQESIHINGGNIRVDGGQYQSIGHLILRPDSDNSGDDLINFLSSDGTSRAHIDGFGLSLNQGFFLNQAYNNVTANIRGKAGDLFYFRTESTTGVDLLQVESNGNVSVRNNLAKGGGSFKIDHPIDPANKYLYHSFVESPDMMNVYNGNITTDANGLAIVALPDYFNALNKEYRYQLTVIGTFAQAIIKQEIENDEFTIQTNEPNIKVSWQVTGIRQDAYANKNRIPNEVDKKAEEKGFYLHPEAFNQPISKGIRVKKEGSTK